MMKTKRQASQYYVYGCRCGVYKIANYWRPFCALQIYNPAIIYCILPNSSFAKKCLAQPRCALQWPPGQLSASPTSPNYLPEDTTWLQTGFCAAAHLEEEGLTWTARKTVRFQVGTPQTSNVHEDGRNLEPKIINNKSCVKLTLK